METSDHRICRGANVRALLVTLALVAVVAGCTSRTEHEPDRAADDVVRSIDPAKATLLTVGEDLAVIAELPHTMGEETLHFTASTQDGMMLGWVAPPPEPQASMGSVPTQSRPVMLDPETKALTVLDKRPRNDKTQLLGIVGSARAVVWLETPSTAVGASDFTMYSYDRLSRKVTELADFTDAHQVVYGGDVALAGDTAYFSTLVQRDKKDIHSVPVDGSKPAAVLIDDGIRAEVDGSQLSYWADDTQFSRDLDTGATVPVPASKHASEVGFCGAEITAAFETWCVGTPDADEHVQDAVLTIKETSGRTTVFEPFPTDSLNGPVPHDIISLGRWTGITMTDDGGADRKFLVDLESGQVVVFPEGTSFGPVSPDGTRVLLSTFAEQGPGPQWIVGLPGAKKPREKRAGTDPAVRVRDAQLVVNKDGSVAVSARLQNKQDYEVALADVRVVVQERAVPVASTMMWLPVPADGRARVGDATDAGGFVVPGGIGSATHATVQFLFDDGTCVSAEAEAVRRTTKHRSVFPVVGDGLGPAVVTDHQGCR